MYCNMIWRSFPQDCFDKVDIDLSCFKPSCWPVDGKAGLSQMSQQGKFGTDIPQDEL